MPLNDILRAIRADTDAQLEALEAAAAAEVAAIEARADTEAQQAEQQAARARDRHAEREASRLVDDARLEARRAMLRAVEAAYQNVLGDLRNRLAAVRHSESYPTILVGLLEEGLDVIGRTDITQVSVDRADVDLARGLVFERLPGAVVVAAAAPCLGGLDLATDDGRVVRNTFESRLARADDRLRGLVAEQLPAGAAT